MNLGELLRLWAAMIHSDGADAHQHWVVLQRRQGELPDLDIGCRPWLIDTGCLHARIISLRDLWMRSPAPCCGPLILDREAPVAAPADERLPSGRAMQAGR